MIEVITDNVYEIFINCIFLLCYVRFERWGFITLVPYL